MGKMTDIALPDIGDFHDVEVIEILVAVGDTVAVEDSLMTLESDKATMEIPSPNAGVVSEVRIAIGDKINKGDVIFVIDSADAVEESVVASRSDHSSSDVVHGLCRLCCSVCVCHCCNARWSFRCRMGTLVASMD